jgi:hypothetical protein
MNMTVPGSHLGTLSFGVEVFRILQIKQRRCDKGGVNYPFFSGDITDAFNPSVPQRTRR